MAKNPSAKTAKNPSAKTAEEKTTPGAEVKSTAAPATKDTIPEEKRGRKPKPLSIEEIQDDTRALIVKIREYEKIKKQNGKSIMRLHAAGQDLERMLRTNLID